MRMAVDFPAPFSPTMAWMVPGSTVMLMWSLARTAPKRFVMFLSWSIALLKHRVGHFDLAGDDFLFRFFGSPDRVGGQEISVVLVDRVGNAVALEAEYVQPRLELPVLDVLTI